MVKGGGPRNMKYKGPPMAAIFFMTSFNRDRGGGMAPLAPPLDPQLTTARILYPGEVQITLKTTKALLD